MAKYEKNICKDTAKNEKGIVTLCDNAFHISYLIFSTLLQQPYELYPRHPLYSSANKVRRVLSIL